jgi:hypothetical protein
MKLVVNASHPLKCRIDSRSSVAHGASDAHEWNKAIHPPVEQLAGLDPQISRHFFFGHEGLMSRVFGCVRVHASGCMSTRLVSEAFKQPARLESESGLKDISERGRTRLRPAPS